MSHYMYPRKFLCRIQVATFVRRTDKGLLMFEGLTSARSRLQFTCWRKMLTMAATTDGCRVEGCLKILTLWGLRYIFKFFVMYSPSTTNLVKLLCCRMSWTLQKKASWTWKKNTISQTQRLLLPSVGGQRAWSQWQWSKANFSPHSWKCPHLPHKSPEKRTNSAFCVWWAWGGDRLVTLTWVVRFPASLLMWMNTVSRLIFRRVMVAPSCSTTATRSVGTKVFRTKVMSGADSATLSAGWASSDIYTPPLLCSPTHSLRKKPNEDADKMSLIKAVVREKILWTESTVWFPFRWGGKIENSATFAADLLREHQEWRQWLWDIVLIRTNHKDCGCAPLQLQFLNITLKTNLNVCVGRFRTTLQSSTWDSV